MVLAEKGAGLYCSFEGWIRVMKTLYFKFKDKVKYHSVIQTSQIFVLPGANVMKQYHGKLPW
jgi:hypothetical protein